jgi:hypothetical protein
MWDDPQELAETFYYRRNLWQTQPKRVEVWSEKGTIRGWSGRFSPSTV